MREFIHTCPARQDKQSVRGLLAKNLLSVLEKPGPERRSNFSSKFLVPPELAVPATCADYPEAFPYLLVWTKFTVFSIFGLDSFQTPPWGSGRLMGADSERFTCRRRSTKKDSNKTSILIL